MADTVADPDKQVSDFQQLMAAKAQGISYISVDPKATEPLEKQAVGQGIPVVAIDKTNLLKDPVGSLSTQIWQGRDHQAYGTMKLMSQLHPDGKVALIGIGAPVPNIKYLVERQKYWAEKVGLEVVGATESKSDDAAGGEVAMAGLLPKQPDGVACYIDTVCIGAGAAARQAGQKVSTIGIGGTPAEVEAVKHGRLTATSR